MIHYRRSPLSIILSQWLTHPPLQGWGVIEGRIQLYKYH